MDDPNTYKKRREKLVTKLGEGIIIIPSHELKVMSNDVNYEFRQYSDLLYLTGFPEPDTIAVIENKNGDIFYTLFVPERDPEYEIWNGKRYGTEGAKEIFGADEAYIFEEFEEKLGEKLLNFETVYLINGIHDKLDEIVNDQIDATINSRKKTGYGPVTKINPTPQIHELRLIKDTKEINLLKQAATISAEAMTKAIEVTKPGLNERHIESLIEYHFAKNGADRPAYPSIVGSGINATILHYIENNSELKEGDLLLIDAGAEYKGYAADITRTWPINGSFGSSQRKIYELVLEVQKKCINMVKPGVVFEEIHNKSIEWLTTGLIDLGLLTGNLQENIDKEHYKRYFMHGIGHYLGLDVHDTSIIGREKELKKGMYLTIEPGVYIPSEEDIPEEYRGIGIRIEDDVLVTQEGCEVLTQGVVKEIDQIEKLVGTKDLP